MLASADVEAASADDAVCSFGEVSVQAPRGRFEVEFHLAFLKLMGQSQDFKARAEPPQHRAPFWGRLREGGGGAVGGRTLSLSSLLPDP